jgi:hypothetical protein
MNLKVLTFPTGSRNDEKTGQYELLHSDSPLN